MRTDLNRVIAEYFYPEWDMLASEYAEGKITINQYWTRFEEIRSDAKKQMVRSNLEAFLGKMRKPEKSILLS